MIMTQEQFKQFIPHYDFTIVVIDNETKQEHKIAHATNDLDEMVYEFGDMLDEIEMAVAMRQA